MAEEILTDMINICQGKDPEADEGARNRLRGRPRDARLARVFGEVYAVDISGRWSARPRGAEPDFPTRMSFEQRKGPAWCASVVAAIRRATGSEVDFAFSSIVFQHIPSREIIENYVREVHRLLRPGGLFKFQVQGRPLTEADAGRHLARRVRFPTSETREMADRCGFELRYRHGAGDQYFWLWFFKKEALDFRLD